MSTEASDVQALQAEVADLRRRVQESEALAEELRRAEEAFRQSEKSLRGLFNATSDAVVLLDLEGRILDLNWVCAAWLGGSFQDLVGRVIYSLFPPDIAAARRAQMEEAGRSGRAVRWVDERSGRVQSNTVYPVMEDDGRLSCYAVFAQDVTQRVRMDEELRRVREELEVRVDERTRELNKVIAQLGREIAERSRTERALRRSEQRYRLLFERMLSGFAFHEILCDEAGKPVDYRFLEINPAFERLTGLVADQVVGKRLYEVLPGNEPYWLETYGKVALTGEPAFFEAYSGALDRYYEVAAYSPEKGFFAVVFNDVTERRLSAEALAEKEAQLRYAQKLARLGHWTRDLPGGEEQCSEALHLLLGYKPGETPAHRDLMLHHVHPEDLQSFGDMAVQAVGSREAVERQLRMVRLDGEERMCRVLIVVVQGQRSSATRLFGCVQDVTERVRAQEAAEFKQQQLIQADKMISLGILGAGVAHEINNPNNFIMLNTPILKGGVGGDRPSAGRPVRGAWRIHGRGPALFGDAPPCPGSAGRHRRRIAAHPAHRPAHQGLRPAGCGRAPAARGPERGGAGGPGAAVQSDQARHQPSGGGLPRGPAAGHGQTPTGWSRWSSMWCSTPAARWKARTRASPFPCIMIRSPARWASASGTRGTAWDQDTMRRVMDPFFTTKRSSGGLGLGLSISQTIVLEHGGEIRFSSEKGKGTTVTIAPAQDTGRPRRRGRRAGRRPETGGRVTTYPPNPVLLVDDEAAALISFDMALRTAGINHTLRCSDGREAYGIVASRELEAVLLDLVMPHVGGEEILERIVADYPEVPVIVATGEGGAETAVRCMKKGAFDYLLKPVDKELLAATVGRALEVRALRRGKRQPGPTHLLRPAGESRSFRAHRHP